MHRSGRDLKILLLIIFFLVFPSSVLGEELTIAFVPRSLGNPIFLDAFESTQKKAIELGVNLEWIAPVDFDSNAQIDIIRNLIRRDVDGIVASVNDDDAVRAVIQEAVEENIAVATFDADCPNSERLFYIGINNYEAGVAIGEALVQVLKRKGLEGVHLDTMIMTGYREALNLEERIKGFIAATKETLNLDIKDILENEDTVEKSIFLLEKYVGDNPDVDVIYFVGGWPFYVSADVLPNFQRWAKQGGIAVGIDLFYDALLLQKEGLIQYLIGQDMSSMGSLGLELIVNYIRHGVTPDEFVEVGLEHANEENLDRLLEIYKPWLVK